MTPHQLETAIKEKASALGLDACGVARATRLNSDVAFFTGWIDKGYHGTMSYMARHLEKRVDPRLLLADAKSVIVVAQNYFPSEQQPPGTTFRISRYAYGTDYHVVLKDKLHLLAGEIARMAGDHKYRVFTDSAPVLERSWAEEAGLGRCGKNGCLSIPRKGSYFFLGELITTIDIQSGKPFTKDLCGKCTRCMDACPTKAIIKPGIIDANKCISYLTIELKGPVPRKYRNQCHGWIFGCDICQEVCPHNTHAHPHKEPRFKALPYVTSWTDDDWSTLPEESYEQYIVGTGSPIARIRFEKLADNISCAAEKP